MKLLGIIALLPCLLSGCGFRCSASPDIGLDAKQALRIYGFDVKCTKRF